MFKPSLARGEIHCIGATTMDQLKENVESINIQFTDEMMDRVNEIHNNNPNPSP